MRTILVYPAIALCAAACTTPLGTLTMISTQPLAAAPAPLGPVVEGVDCAHFLLFSAVGGDPSSSIERAMRQAQEQVPEGNVLTDVTLHSEVMFAYIYNRTCSRVRGTVAVAK